MKFAEVAENVKPLVYGSPKATGVQLKKKVWFKNVTQASRLSDPVPQAARLPDPVEPSDNEQAGRSFYDPNTTSRSEKECRKVTGRSPTSWRGVQMPDSLRAAHHNLDQAVARLYRSKPFSSDEERLEHLFKRYKEMIAKEQLV